MIKPMRLTHTERGFTLVEMLVVLLILGGLASVVVLAITQFLENGNVEAANTELHQARTAIETCFSEAGVTCIDGSTPVEWNGAEDTVTATNGQGVVYDAADYLRAKTFKATYTVSLSGDITTATNQGWVDVTWTDGHWE